MSYEYSYYKRKATLENLIFERNLRQRNSLYWTTKDGREIKLSDMSDQHLNNVINMLIREDDFCNEID